MVTINDENTRLGSASIEATLALVFFIFAVWAIYALADFCILQGKITYAIDTTAKEMSQYSYLYYKIGAHDLVKGMNEGSQLVVETYSTFSEVVNKGEKTAESVANDPGETLKSALSGGDADQLSWADVKVAANSVSDIVKNPTQYMKSLAALAGSKISTKASYIVASALANGMTKRHFGSEAQANRYLKNMGVERGWEGLDFSMSNAFASGSEKIEIVVVYKVNIKNIVPALDKEITVCNKAVTKGWLGGDDGDKS